MEYTPFIFVESGICIYRAKVLTKNDLDALSLPLLPEISWLFSFLITNCHDLKRSSPEVPAVYHRGMAKPKISFESPMPCLPESTVCFSGWASCVNRLHFFQKHRTKEILFIRDMTSHSHSLLAASENNCVWLDKIKLAYLRWPPQLGNLPASYEFDSYIFVFLN